MDSEFEKYYNRWGDPTVEMHRAYDSWLDDMSNRDGAQLVPFEFDIEKYPEQSIYVPKVEAHDPYEKVPDILYYPAFNYRMMRSFGAIAFQRLLHQFNSQSSSADDDTSLAEHLISNQLDGKNTLVVTSHFTFPELGFFKALRFHAKGDRSNITKNGVILNKLMSRQTHGGKKLVDQFKTASNIYFSYPKSTSAEKHGVPRSAMLLGNALLRKVLTPDLEKGGLELDVALTGKQIVPVKNELGLVDHYEIPDIDPSSVKLIESFDELVSATLIDSPVSGRWEMQIGEVLDLGELLKTNSASEIVDSVYVGISSSVEQMTGKEAVYNRLSKP